MVPVTRGKRNHFAHLEDVNDRQEPVREEPPATYQEHSEAQFASLREQIAALTKQLSIKNEQDRCRHIPSPHESEEEDARMEDDNGNPFAEHGVHKHQPLVQAQANWWEFSFKLDIQEFNGGLQPEEFLDWVVVVEEVLEFKGVPKDQRVSLVATRGGQNPPNPTNPICPTPKIIEFQLYLSSTGLKTLNPYGSGRSAGIIF